MIPKRLHLCPSHLTQGQPPPRHRLRAVMMPAPRYLAPGGGRGARCVRTGLGSCGREGTWKGEANLEGNFQLG